jgi:hypothetical protein
MHARGFCSALPHNFQQEHMRHASRIWVLPLSAGMALSLSATTQASSPPHSTPSPYASQTHNAPRETAPIPEALPARNHPAMIAQADTAAANAEADDNGETMEHADQSGLATPDIFRFPGTMASTWAQ